MNSRATSTTWIGQSRLGLGWGLFSGHAGDNGLHAHHAVQIMLSHHLQDVVLADGRVHRCRGLMIGPDVPHRLSASSWPVTLLYLEPDSREGRHAMGFLSEGWIELTDDLTASALAALTTDRTENPAAWVVHKMGGGASSPSLKRDPLIESVIESLPSILPKLVSVASLATQAGLSDSRFQHRFRAHTGLAVRPYLRWRRLLTAIDAVRRRRALTEAALDAGFADAPHFSRTFRRHFGIAPRVLQQLESSQ